MQNDILSAVSRLGMDLATWDAKWDVYYPVSDVLEVAIALPLRRVVVNHVWVVLPQIG